MAAGQKPINNVVDITNYAMLLTGQPLHAFDLDHVAGRRLTVRRAADGEQVDTLDGETRTLDAEMVVIADAEGPTSIAGVKGGARSEVRPETTRVLLEVATWSGPNIHRTSWNLGLRSEASGRFEKGLAPEQCMHAQAVATRLLIECCGARVAPGTIDVGWDGAPEQVIRLREARVEAILGLPVPRERQAEILEALDFQTVAASDPGAPERDGLDVTVPALRRVDVTREVDLIEEVARIDGLEKLPATLPARRGAVGLLSHAQKVRRAAEDALVGRGLHEIVGWSFTDPGLLDRLRLAGEHPLRRVVRIENPMSETQSTMRPTLLGSLLDAARHNVARNGPDVAIFESGAVYRSRPPHAPSAPDGATPNGATPVEEHHALGALLTGALGGRASKSWRGELAEADFFAGQGAAGGGARQVPRCLVGAAGRRLAIPASRPLPPRCLPVGGASREARLRGGGAPARRRGVGPGAYGRVRDRPRQARRRGSTRGGLRAVRVGAVAAPGSRGRPARRRWPPRGCWSR